MMRKTVLMLAMMMAGVSSGVMASVDTGSWYTGLKAGWSDYYNEDLGHHVSQNSNASTQLGVKGAGGVFLGYQATDWLALEGGYDYLGNMRVSSNNSSGANMENQGIQLAVKLGLPVTDKWGLYTRMGMMGWHARTKNASHAMNDEGISPLAALGAELSMGEDWSLRLEYQYVANIGEGGDTGITVDNGQTSLGIIYHFGQAALPTLPPSMSTGMKTVMAVSLVAAKRVYTGIKK
ncbi:outer membrane beta-barrel protein [Serratia marcescens]|uniref:outer membrane beta-barrel protein n=1 Tax=Serratia marcescens TaxID=615 RepID=UPI0038B39EC1|nr:outer membrane beta-barrel protein [Serratia marcescens]